MRDGHAVEPEFRILGPLEITLGERAISPGGRRERAILAILLLNIGEVVSVERLIDGVWGDARPSSAKHMVHEYVSRLRQTLVEVSPVTTRPPGYVLDSACATLDVREFRRLIAAARRQPHAEALRSYDQALTLWRGDALADVALEGDAQIAAARLDQERRLVDEERIDCALALGQHLQLIPELEHRVEEAPLRERTRAQLMLALYRAGRQTEALDRYRDGRALLVEHAGVEPGPDLHQLERAILTHDPALELAPPVRDDAQADGAATGRRGRGPPESVGRRRWTRAALVAGVLVAALVATVIFLVGRTGSTNALAHIDANSAGAIDPGNNRLVDEVSVGAGPGRIAAGFGSLWVVNDYDNTVSRIDPATGTRTDIIQVDGDPTAIAVGAGFVWVACTGTRSVDRIYPGIDTVTAADHRRERLERDRDQPSRSLGDRPAGRHRDRDRLEDRQGLGTLDAGPTPSDIAYGFGALWIANESSSTVTRLDPRTGGLQDVQCRKRARGGRDRVRRDLGREQPRRNRLPHRSEHPRRRPIPVGPGPSSLLAGDGAIWVADSYGNRIVRIDPATNHIVRTITVGSAPQSLASIDGRVWLSARETAAVHRGGTLRLYAEDTLDSLDEGAGYTSTAWSVFATTGDGLVGLKRVGGLDGGTLVPDLATSLPEPTNDGRTYTFQLQRGIHYSNGDPVRASDLRRALERAFRIGPVPGLFFGALVGADACSKSDPRRPRESQPPLPVEGTPRPATSPVVSSLTIAPAR